LSAIVADGAPAREVARIDELAARTPASLAKAAQTAQARAPESDLPTRLIERVTARVSRCREGARPLSDARRHLRG
jgi:hypothetical protein